MLVIHDEELVRQLQALAEQQQRPVEEVLRVFIDRFAAEEPAPVTEDPQADRIRQLKRKAYADARRYWEATDNQQRLQLTDTELDEQFCCFDESGVPRLNSDYDKEQRASLAQIAEHAQRNNIKLRQGFPARESREVLNTYFADDLQRRTRDDKR